MNRVCTIVVMCVSAFAGPCELANGQASPTSERPASPARLEAGGFELSGLAVVEDGMLVVDDELVGAVLFVRDGREKRLAQMVKIERKRTESEPFTHLPRLSAVQDFEGIASDGKNKVFFIGSHNGKDGDRRPDREFLIEAKWKAADRELAWQRETRALAKQLEPALKKLQVSIGLTNTKIDSKFDIEGLGYSDGKIYIGLRGPLTSKSEAIVVRTDADSLFDPNNEAKFEALPLSLEHGGIRSLEWDSVTKKLLILSGPAGDAVDAVSALWAFDPVSGAVNLIHKFTPEELGAGRKVRSAEGVCRDASGKIVVAFDGSEEGSPNLLLLDWP
jgi:hypothetical protein